MKNKKEKSLKHSNSFFIAILIIGFALLLVFILDKQKEKKFEEQKQTNNNEHKPTEIVEERKNEIINISDKVFEEVISQGLVLVDFWAPWCPPCRVQNPILEELALNLDFNATIAKLNVDHNPFSANKYNVRNIPTIIIFKEGEVVSRFVGVQQKETLRDELKRHYN